MIIIPLIFFAWVIFVIVVGLVIYWRSQVRKRYRIQANDNVQHEQQLSFGQRYWLLICIIVAIVSPIAVGWLQAGRHHDLYNEEMEQRRPGAQSGPGTMSSDTGTAGSAGSTSKDTSYHVAAPPKH